MDCREEVAILERRFKNLLGLEDFSADLIGQRLHVKYDAAKLSTAAIADAVADTGMRAWLEHEEPIVGGDRAARVRQALVWTRRRRAGGRPGVVERLGSPTVLRRACCSPLSLAAGVAATARKAWSAARPRSLDINVLMLVAAAGAIALGEWSEAAAVVFLFALAQALEARTLDRARDADPRADGSDAGRRARPRRRRRATRRGRRRRARRGDRRPAGREDPARRRRRRRARAP